MKDNEIIKALECCIHDDEGTKERPCQDCPLLQDDACSNSLRKHSLDLIKSLTEQNKGLQEEVAIKTDMLNHQKSEIERLQERYKRASDNLKAVLDERADHTEAKKEYDKRLWTECNKIMNTFTLCWLKGIREQVLKEMVGDDNA